MPTKGSAPSPRLTRFVWNHGISPRGGTIRGGGPRGVPSVQGRHGNPGMPPEIFAAIDRLFALDQRTAYYNILVPLLMQMYHRSFKGALQKPGVDYEQFDLSEGGARARSQRCSGPCPWGLCGAACGSPGRIHGSTYTEFQNMAESEAARRDRGFLQRFGHLSNIGVDFSAVPWRETPDLVLGWSPHFPLRRPARNEARLKTSPSPAPSADGPASCTTAPAVPAVPCPGRGSLYAWLRVLPPVLPCACRACVQAE